MLNKFCFHLYAQNSLFIAENCNAFFYHHHLLITLTCYFRCHRAGSQLKTSKIVTSSISRAGPLYRYWPVSGCSQTSGYLPIWQTVAVAVQEMTTRNLPVRSEAVNTAANYPATPLAPYFYYSSYGLGDQIQRRHFEVSKETPFAISVYIRQTSSLGQAATESHCRCPSYSERSWGC